MAQFSKFTAKFEDESNILFEADNVDAALSLVKDNPRVVSLEIKLK